MWELTPQSIKTLVDEKIALPRFQRKPTWTSKQKLDLALSFFNRYPLGTVVIKVDGDSGKFLLDGRQRREALQGIRDPEVVYDWAKSVLGFTNKSLPADIATLYYEYVGEYFGAEPFQVGDAVAAESVVDPASMAPAALGVSAETTDEGEEADLAAVEEGATTEQAVDQSNGHEEAVEVGIHELLRVILLSHGIWKGRTNFVRRFDPIVGQFSRHEIAGKKPAPPKLTADSKSLRKWILDWKSDAPETPGEFAPSQDEFVEQFIASGDVALTDTGKVKAAIAAEWPAIEETVRLVTRLDTRLADEKIGRLEISNVSHATERKIFELINSAGSPLTAAEILSANHGWNRELPSAEDRVLDAARRLYDMMDIALQEPLVRWDAAATLMDRLDLPAVFGDLGGASGLQEPKQGSSRFERRITMGFKLLAGWYSQAIDKNTIADLGKLDIADGKSIAWGQCQFEDLATTAVRRATDQEVFRLWIDWGLSLVGNTTDAAAFNFVLLLSRDWERRKMPPSGARFKAFQKNARVLLDRTVFEHISGFWGGSGDSRIRRNLEAFQATAANALFAQVEEGEWTGLLKQLADGRLREADYGGRLNDRVVLLLLYRNVLRRLALEGPSSGGPRSFEVDHIIPQEAFASEPDESLKKLTHHIGNLAPIPSDLNNRKRSHYLKDLKDAADVSALERYEDVPKTKFKEFASTGAVQKLVTFRSEVILGDFLDLRRRMING